MAAVAAHKPKPSRAALCRTYMVTVLARFVSRLPPHRFRRLVLARSRARAHTIDDEGVSRTIETAVDYVQQSGWPLVDKGCLTRGLTLFWLLRRSGVTGLSLAFGVGSDDGSPAAHCWLVRDAQPFLERTDPRAKFTEIWRIEDEDAPK